jgi:hypothetical protein
MGPSRRSAAAHGAQVHRGRAAGGGQEPRGARRGVGEGRGRDSRRRTARRHQPAARVPPPSPRAPGRRAPPLRERARDRAPHAQQQGSAPCPPPPPRAARAPARPRPRRASPRAPAGSRAAAQPLAGAAWRGRRARRGRRRTREAAARALAEQPHGLAHLRRVHAAGPPPPRPPSQAMLSRTTSFILSEWRTSYELLIRQQPESPAAPPQPRARPACARPPTAPPRPRPPPALISRNVAFSVERRAGRDGATHVLARNGPPHAFWLFARLGRRRCGWARGRRRACGGVAAERVGALARRAGAGGAQRGAPGAGGGAPRRTRPLRCGRGVRAGAVVRGGDEQSAEGPPPLLGCVRPDASIQTHPL